MKTPGHCRCVVFDLDGTLIDSREDLAAAVNMTRREFGLSPLPLDRVTSYVGDGMRKLMQRALADASVDIDEAVKAMKRNYGENLVAATTLYPGVFDGVGTLLESGWSLAVVSNKPTEFCRTILRRFDLEDAFTEIIGGGSAFPLKPDPSSLHHILKVTGSAASKSWVMGDNHTDLEAGSRAGMKRCYAAFGFGDPQDKPFDFKAASFQDFVAVLAKEPR